MAAERVEEPTAHYRGGGCDGDVDMVSGNVDDVEVVRESL